jgi:positive phototaxis protein PixI
MIQPTKNATAKHYLIFSLGAKERAGIAIEEIVEVFQLSFSEILPVERVPSCILGIYQWHSEIIWLVDLEILVGLTPLKSTTTKLMIIVMKQHNRYVGLCVRKLLDLQMLNPAEIQSPQPQVFRADLLPFLRGYTVEQNQEILKILNSQAIIQSSIWEDNN